MNRLVLFIACVGCLSTGWAQQTSDAQVITDANRSIAPAYRMYLRPQMMDTTITSPSVNYPLLALHKETTIKVEGIKPASIRLRPQLDELYNSYVKLGVGSRLQALGELYFNSKRSRKYNWGVHALHHSEWGSIKKYAPSQYDHTNIKAFGKIEETRYTYGAHVYYRNDGVHYYGFQNPAADRDSIRQRYQGAGFNAFMYSHVKDSSHLNYRIGLFYNYFGDKRPEDKELKDWRVKENFVGMKTRMEYDGEAGKLLSNLAVDFNWAYNGYRYGNSDTTLSPIDTTISVDNVVAQLRPMFSFYSHNKKLKFKLGGEIALNYMNKAHFSLYPIAEVKYSLFNDIFIPYVGIKGGLKQQRFEYLAATNPFIHSNQELRNKKVYNFYFGIKGSISSRVSFNAAASFARLTNQALFINDTLYSSGNEFRATYDTITRTTITASVSYQQNEKLKIDLIGHFYSYQTKANPRAWNLPQLEIIARGTYNILDRLIARLDFTLETGRYARVFDPTLDDVQTEDGLLYQKLGVMADANLGIEFRYSKRFSIFVNFNNIGAQDYQRWLNYPVNAFQFMAGVTFRF